MSVEKLVEHFLALEDPRCAGKVEHRLIDILVIVVCAVIACAESWDDITLYGRNKLGWLQSERAEPGHRRFHPKEWSHCGLFHSLRKSPRRVVAPELMPLSSTGCRPWITCQTPWRSSQSGSVTR
jgi:hypothetical protein